MCTSASRMTKRKAVDLGLYALIAVLALCMIVPAMAGAPAEENLLRNPDFECSFVQYGPFRTAIVAEGWMPWWRSQGRSDPAWQNRMPEFKAAAPYKNRVHSGSNAQQLFTAYGTHIGGIYQVIKNVQPGSTVRFSIWGHAWAGQNDDPFQSVAGGPMHMAVGIDPAGGTSAFSSRVIWSTEQSPLDEWVPFTVEAVAAGNAVTVFTRSAPEFPTKHNDVYWDDAELIVARPAPTPTATPRIFFSLPDATPTAVLEVEDGPATGSTELTCTPTTVSQSTSSPTLQPASDRANTRAQPTATPAFTFPVTGTVCVTVYEDRNGNRSQDSNEPMVADARLALENEGTAVSEFLTTTDEMVCFDGLDVSTYYLFVTAPPGYRSPASDTWRVRLGEQDVHILVGLRKTYRPAWQLAQTEGSSPASEKADGIFAPWIAFLIAGGILSIIGWSVLGRH